jgi:hypothetical protein
MKRDATHSFFAGSERDAETAADFESVGEILGEGAPAFAPRGCVLFFGIGRLPAIATGEGIVRAFQRPLG